MMLTHTMRKATTTTLAIASATKAREKGGVATTVTPRRVMLAQKNTVTQIW
jgi:hypothetical protein